MIDTGLLNENQKKAVLSDSRYLRIVAGAGSGKTRVLTMRIAHLIEDERVPAWKTSWYSLVVCPVPSIWPTTGS